ncbi:MAG: endonuclease/exonuclease/phosphatase family protein [Chlamydiia bacterium]|nr:endonuclease/exonuclease/phosphatase family protein [Chlamydiia bacterium]
MNCHSHSCSDFFEYSYGVKNIFWKEESRYTSTKNHTSGVMMQVEITTVNVSWFNTRDKRSEQIDNETQSVNAIGKTIQNTSEQNGYQFPHFIGIGEITYDIPDVPNGKCTTEGQNLKKLTDTFPVKDPETCFSLGNIGLNAKRTPSGNYVMTREDTDKVNKYADLVNYGLFPGQYNTGAASYLPISQVKTVKNLKWTDFHPGVNPSQWKDDNGNSIPDDCQLFDKLFMDITVNVNGIDLHFIVLHAVPASGFGNQETPDLQRNKDQLAFLQWYLSGSTYFSVPEGINEDGDPIIPLSERQVEYFIAMGDWNADYRDTSCPGSEVLRSLFETYAWFPSEGITNRDPSGSFEGILDYMLCSKKIRCLNYYVSIINEKVSDHAAINATFQLETDAVQEESGWCSIS